MNGSTIDTFGAGKIFVKLSYPNSDKSILHAQCLAAHGFDVCIQPKYRNDRVLRHYVGRTQLHWTQTTFDRTQWKLAKEKKKVAQHEAYAHHQTQSERHRACSPTHRHHYMQSILPTQTHASDSTWLVQQGTLCILMLSPYNVMYDTVRCVIVTVVVVFVVSRYTHSTHIDEFYI